MEKIIGNYCDLINEKDILDDFDIFMNYGYHKKKEYSLSNIINEFIEYLEKDIIETFDKNEVQQVKKDIRKICFDNKNFLLNRYGK